VMSIQESKTMVKNRLLPHHREMLKASAITGKVAKGRGYRSVTTKAELKRLGFGEGQRLVPGLLIPIWSVDGEIATHQFRPDAPRIRDGHPVKYESPSGAHNFLDIPRRARKRLGKPKYPLYVTEGAKKADAGVSKGLCCIAVLGVWSWRGTNAHGGTTALADWERIALKGRKTYLVFDSDVMEKAEVYVALTRLKAFLESRGAEVRLIYLPPGKGGRKVGLDDYFAAGHSKKELLALATDELHPAPKSNSPAERFTVDGGQICRIVRTNEGMSHVPLCNFKARITEELLLDDGLEQHRAFEIFGRLATGEKFSKIRVPIAKFGSMNWVSEEWGGKAIVYAGQNNRDYLREAIQQRSSKAPCRRVFVHTGWRQLDGKQVYLSANGALGQERVEVDLGPELRRYRLPREIRNPKAAMKASLRLLDVAPLSVTVPLLAAMYRAPLSSALPVDHCLWLEGATGSLKSTIAALFLCHFGKFDREHLPGAWSSTANLLEKRAFALKDVPYVIDDYAPNALDAREMEGKAARVIRSQGNRSGRERLKSDLSDRPTFRPRGLIVSTGEGHPPGHSLLARVLLIEVTRPTVNLTVLSQAQRDAGELRHAMAGFIRWLGRNWPTRRQLSKRFEKVRDKARKASAHLRVPELIANLWIGFELALEYAQDVGACSVKRVKRLRKKGWKVLLRAGCEQARAVTDERPTLRFLRVLQTVVLQKHAVLHPKSTSLQSAEDGTGTFIGWRDDEHLYLLPDATYKEVNRFCRDEGEPFPVREKRIRKDLLLQKISEPDAGRTTASVNVGGKTRRVLRLRRAVVEKLLGEEFPG
jgi:hypothetical protein